MGETGWLLARTSLLSNRVSVHGATETVSRGRLENGCLRSNRPSVCASAHIPAGGIASIGDTESRPVCRTPDRSSSRRVQARCVGSVEGVSLSFVARSSKSKDQDGMGSGPLGKGWCESRFKSPASVGRRAGKKRKREILGAQLQPGGNSSLFLSLSRSSLVSAALGETRNGNILSKDSESRANRASRAKQSMGRLLKQAKKEWQVQLCWPRLLPRYAHLARAPGGTGYVLPYLPAKLMLMT